MSLSIGVNLRVTGHCNQGGRRYMEDMFRVAYQRSSDGKDLECAFFGIFDGHGGGEAAIFAKEHLMDIIIKQKNFWSDNDDDVLRAIRDGYVNTHYAMWRELDKWPRTASGLPSTAGTTASVAFIRKGKIYIGHVGDSGIVLGYEEKDCSQWRAKPLTRDHKPESDPEMTRIQESGGKVVNKSGVPRVVWNRPRIGHRGPVRRSTLIDEIPFLAVARSLGDLWSYNSELDTFVVSPEPDVQVVTIDVSTHRCLIFGTDGLWNMMSPEAAVHIVQATERHNEKHLIASQQTGNGQTETQMWINPSKSLVDRALCRWSMTRLRADNTSVVTLMLDPPTPARGEATISQKKEVPIIPKVPSMPMSSTEKDPVDIDSSVAVECSSPLKISNSAEVDFGTPKEADSSNTTILDMTTQQETSKIEHDENNESIQVAEISSSKDDELTCTSDLERTIKESSPEIDVETIDEVELLSMPRKDVDVDSQNNEKDKEDKDEKNKKEQQQLRLRRGTKETTSTSSVNGIHRPKRKRDSLEKRAIYATMTRRANRMSSSKSHENLAQNEAFGGVRLRRETRSLPSNAESKSNIGQTEGTRLGTDKSNENNNGSKETDTFLKRRTRSEVQTDATDENDPTNQKLGEPCKRLKWSSTDNGSEVSSATKGGSERKLSSPTPFQRRNLEKKVSPAKGGVRRGSFNESNRLLRLNINHDSSRQNRNCNQRGGTNNHRVVMGNNQSYDVFNGNSNTEMHRWLRSDTIAATPIKTLRSRNVDIAGHTISAQMAPRYDCVKNNRSSLPAKLRNNTNTLTTSSPAANKTNCVTPVSTTSTTKSKQVNGVASSSASAPMIKRTRSRFKRLGK